MHNQEFRDSRWNFEMVSVQILSLFNCNNYTAFFSFSLINYCITKIRLLQRNGIKPLLVFDGQRLKMKERVEIERAKLRVEAKDKAKQMLMNGDFAGAARKYIEGIEITSEMIFLFIRELRSLKIEFIVAPYEADAQLAYLYSQGKIDVVLTEDSDLLLFGANKCFFKMDMSGKGIEIDL